MSQTVIRDSSVIMKREAASLYVYLKSLDFFVPYCWRLKNRARSKYRKEYVAVTTKEG